eukprot:gene4810-8396_t
MNLSECLLSCFACQESLLVDTSKFKNIEIIQNIISLYTETCSILYCSKNTTADELFIFFIQPPNPIPKFRKKETNSLRSGDYDEQQEEDDEDDEDEETITEIILSKKPTKNRILVSAKHNFQKNKNIESSEEDIKDDNTPPYLQNNISILYNIDKLNKKTQNILMEIMIHKKFEIKGKTFLLNPNLMFFSTFNSISNLNLNLLNQFLLFCNKESKDISNNLQLKSLQSSFQNLKLSNLIEQYCRDIIVSIRLQNDVIIKPLTSSIKSLEIASKSFAVLNSKSFVTYSDVNLISSNVLSHKIKLKNDLNTMDFINQLINELPKNY